MTEKEIGELYIRLAFQYESAISRLLDKKIIDQDLVDRHRKSFYDSLNEEKLRTAQKIGDYTEIIRRYMRGMICEDMVSLTGLAKQYSVDFPGYTIQSWMRSRNTLEFLRQWENDINEEFDDRACEELIHLGHTTSLTITPSLWIRKTHAVGMHVKQGKGGGVSAYPEIAADFHLWLDPKVRLAIVRNRM
ncbi:hypothetical protein D1641_11195 [Colidextribacter sp. OB.20]|uniref:KilA-N domain-containing protein n=1 Tax=Colidextribacter sp. OB.20 TaxID=2304568 RepID=UPI0013691BFF|nr:KilA-N domain-containing protein [Colidextribacter sp. OB.20]NBI10574.1 hypothetical protein [Colidextribacter sp. OB.20]